MQMELHSNAHIPDGLLASMTLLSEKPRLGVPSRESALHPGINERNSTAVLGLRFGWSGIVSGTVVAPNNALAVASKIASCTGQSLKNNGVALLLDGAGFIPGESILAAGAQTAVATASFINSAYHQDAIGAGAAYVGSGVAPLGFIAKEAGFAWAKAIPFAGYVVNGVATAHDLWSTGSELYSCATKP